MSIRLFNSAGGYIDLESGGTSAAANVFTLPAETGTILTSATLSGINASALSAGTLAAARLPAGSVLQVVSNTTTTGVTVSTTSYTDTGLSASITPTSASSKILVLVNQMCNLYRNPGGNYFGLKLFRGATAILNPVEDSTGPFDFGSVAGSVETNLAIRASIVYLDSPNTTSSTTYKTQGRPYLTSSSGSVAFQSNANVSNATSTIILMEIAG